jgi:hypothetical protein
MASFALIPAREIDFLSLRLLLERSTGGSKLKKDRAVAHLTKAWRRGELMIPPNENEQHKWWRCEARFMLGDYSDWRGWEYRDDWAATLWHWKDTKPYPVPPWNGLKTEKLYIIGEQGVGDEVFFASCLQEAINRSDECILECQPRLRSVFERCFGIKTTPADIKGTKRFKKDLPDGVTAWMALADLPRLFRTSLASFPGTPILSPDPPQAERFRAYRGRVGVSWRGAQGTVPELMKIPGAISLQYDRSWDEEIEEPEGLDLRGDIEGILALLSNLESVVSVSTSVAHFAASLGRRTHVVIADPTTGVRGNLFPFKFLCMATQGRTPWYGSVRSYKNLHEYQSVNANK